jgi:hypothetical protein
VATLMIPATDEAAREAVPAAPNDVDDPVYALGDATPAIYHTLADLMGVVDPNATITVFRDWEHFPLAVIDGDDRFWSFYITDNGRIGEGGVNQPRYFDSVAALLAGRDA